MHFRVCPRCRQRKPIIANIPGNAGKYCPQCSVETCACNKAFYSMLSNHETGLPELDLFLNEWYRIENGAHY